MEDKNNISRREFLKRAGVAGIAATGLAACKGKDKQASTGVGIPEGQMTFRTNPSTGDKVSLLGQSLAPGIRHDAASFRRGKERTGRQRRNRPANGQ